MDSVPFLREQLKSSARGFRRHGRWWLLRDQRENAIASQEHMDLGRPGLWRTIQENDRFYRIFELNQSIVDCSENEVATDPNETDRSVLDACLDWALASSEDKIQDGWQTPLRSEVEALIAQRSLTIIAGNEARQGGLIWAPDRLALRFPVVPLVPSSLPELRLHWLRQHLSDAQNHWRLVRFGFSRTEEKLSVIAEVDLSGAPRAALEPLLSSSLDALHEAVAWLVETAVLLADASVALRALECGPKPQPSKMKD